MRKCIVDLLKKFHFNNSNSNPRYLKILKAITFNRINSLKVYRFQHTFNRKIRALTQIVCNHPKSYTSADWNGGYKKCGVCYKTLETLWSPTIVEGKHE